MARNRFGGDAASWLFSTSGNIVVVPGPGHSVTAWSGPADDLDRTEYADLRAVDDAVTVLTAVPVIASGQVPEFDGPDDAAVTRLWISADDGATGVWITTTTLAKAAATGSYTDLGDKPTIPTTPGQVGADAAGAATSAVSGHVAAIDPHGDRAYADGQVTTERSRAQGVEAAKADLVGGKVPSSQIPSVALEHGVITVANAAARYALVLHSTIELGQPVVQASTGQTFLLVDGATDPSQSGQWIEIPAIGKVQSVNGSQGAVVLAAGDVGAEPAIAAPSSAPTSKYMRGDKTWQDLAGDPGLSAAFAQRWQAAHAYLANDLALAPDGTIIQRIANGTSRASYDVTEQALWTVKSGSGSDLADVTVAGASAQLAAGRTSNVAANGAYTSPALDGAVATPPKRWAIKAASGGGCTITYPDQGGTSTTVTLLAGEVLTFRQKTTSGWGVESGNKPLTQLDTRFAPYGLAVGRGGAVVPIGLHGKSNAQGLSDGVSTSSTFTTFHPLTDPKANAVLPVFPNWYGTSDTIGPNAITVAAAVQCADGTVIPFTFNGQHTVTIAPGGYAVPDGPIGFGAQQVLNSLGVGVVALSGVFIRTYVSVASAGMKWPVGIDPRLVTGEGNNGASGADLTANGATGVVNGAFSYAYGPAILLGKARARKPIVAVVGDSQIEGSNDNALNRGYAERAIEALGFPMVKVAKGGESAQQFAATSGRKYRMALLDGCTHAIVNYGTNDLVTNGRTAAQLQADLLTIWTYLAGLGMKVYQTTITPRTTSTDNWTTTVNQTANGAGTTTDPTRLAAVNDYIRAQAGVGPLTGVIEISDAFSSARNSGLWKTNTGTSGSLRDVTDDGTHMSKDGIVNIGKPLVQAAIQDWTA